MVKKGGLCNALMSTEDIFKSAQFNASQHTLYKQSNQCICKIDLKHYFKQRDEKE